MIAAGLDALAQQQNPVVSLAMLAVLIVIVVLVRRGRKLSTPGTVQRGERVRPVAITLLDPVVSIIVIGDVAWRLLSHGGSHVFAGFVGAVIGIGIGVARARVMYVRTLPESTNIVLRRSPIEYGLVFVLIILRSVEATVERAGSTTASLLLTALVCLGVVEAVTRSTLVIRQFWLDRTPTSTSSN